MAGKTKKSDAKATREARRSMSLLDQAQHTAHLKARDRRAEGRAARNAVPLASHAGFSPAAGRSDSVALLQGQDNLRIASLVPIRFGRMSASPFSFYRGAAIVMADDLAGTPITGWLVQACGDAHLDNFGGFATDRAQPRLRRERLRRDAARPLGMGRQAPGGELSPWRPGPPGHRGGARRGAAASGSVSYRERMEQLRRCHDLDVWYARVDVDELALDARGRERASYEDLRRQAAPARRLQAFTKLTSCVDGRRRIIERPAAHRPPRRGRVTRRQVVAVVPRVLPSFPTIAACSSSDTESVDVARKVVGVGSVGTRC